MNDGKGNLSYKRIHVHHGHISWSVQVGSKTKTGEFHDQGDNVKKYYLFIITLTTTKNALRAANTGRPTGQPMVGYPKGVSL
jgi:hypothetical protein